MYLDWGSITQKRTDKLLENDRGIMLKTGKNSIKMNKMNSVQYKKQRLFHIQPVPS